LGGVLEAMYLATVLGLIPSFLAIAARLIPDDRSFPVN
jgi:hypothetical protein